MILHLRSLALSQSLSRNLRLYSYTCISISNKNVPNYTKNDTRNFSMQSTFESFGQTQMKIFKTLSESTAVSYTQDFLLNIHSYTGLPWWASIIASTVLLRVCITTPLAIYQNYVLAKVQNLQLEMPEIVEELKREMDIAVRQYHLTEAQAKYLFKSSLKKQWDKLIVRDNCHPFKASLLLWVQIPLWICVSISFRNLVYMLPKSNELAHLTYFELVLGGVAWIPNLTVPDASLILPILLGIVNLSIIEVQTMSKLGEPTKFQRRITNFFRAITLLLVPISATVPSCMCLYWTTSSVYGLVQNLVLLSPKVRRACRIPKTTNEIEKPYTHLWSVTKKRFIRNKQVES